MVDYISGNNDEISEFGDDNEEGEDPDNPNTMGFGEGDDDE